MLNIALYTYSIKNIDDRQKKNTKLHLPIIQIAQIIVLRY